MAHLILSRRSFILSNRNSLFLVSDYLNYPQRLPGYQIKKFGSIFGKFLFNNRGMNNVNF